MSVLQPPSPNPPPQGWERLNQGAPIAVMLAAVLLVLYRLLPVLELIAIAVLLAVIFETLLDGLQRLVKVRWLALLLLAGLALGFAALMVLVVIPGLLQEVNALASTLPDYGDTLTRRTEAIQRQFRVSIDFTEGINRLTAFVYNSVARLPSLLGQTFGLTIEAIATFFLALYIAQDPDFFVKGTIRLAPKNQRLQLQRIMHKSRAKIRGWLFGTAIAMLFLGASTTLGLWLIGIPLFLSFGVIAGLFQIVPYFGSIIGVFLPALVALTISPAKLFWVLGLFFTLNQIDAYLLQPIVVGNRVNLHPAVVVVAFLVMENLLGFAGILVAVPTAATILAVFEEW